MTASVSFRQSRHVVCLQILLTALCLLHAGQTRCTGAHRRTYTTPPISAGERAVHAARLHATVIFFVQRLTELGMCECAGSESSIAAVQEGLGGVSCIIRAAFHGALVSDILAHPHVLSPRPAVLCSLRCCIVTTGCCSSRWKRPKTSSHRRSHLPPHHYQLHCQLPRNTFSQQLLKKVPDPANTKKNRLF